MVIGGKPDSIKYVLILLIPELVPIIKDYLFQYPDKLNLYLDKRINVDNLIKYISKNEKLRTKCNVEPVDILEIIKEYIENVNRWAIKSCNINI